MYTYDDGSTLTEYDDGSILATSAPDANGAYTATGTMTQDAAETAKFQQFYPNSSEPWWQQAARVGLTRAIDSHYATTEVNKTSTPATYAGQNGQTYAAGGGSGMLAGKNGLMLVGLAVAALVLLSHGGK